MSISYKSNLLKIISMPLAECSMKRSTYLFYEHLKIQQHNQKISRLSSTTQHVMPPEFGRKWGT